jgi:chromosome partitioning protein
MFIQEYSKMASRIYAIAQQKGGVAKTTSTINLGAALKERGHRVLLVDLDPQGALTAGLGIEPLNLAGTIYNVLRDPAFSAQQALITEDIECHLLPANIDLSASELELVSEPGRERVLKEKLTPLLGDYDYILIDCPPSLSLLTLNALAAATRVIIPVATQYFALRGMELLLQTIGKVKHRINPDLEICGILPTMFNSQTTHSREVLDELKGTYKEQIFSTTIPYTVRFQDSVMAGQSVLSASPTSSAAQAYKDLAEEVEKRG